MADKARYRTRAMMDMAAAFAHGARKGKRMGWSAQAAEFGEGWLADRLDNSTVDYWSVRADALQRAYDVGRLAATLAESEGKAEILVRHIKAALNEFGPGPGTGRRFLEYCPF